MSLGLREYARHRRSAGLSGGTLKAVQTAIDSGRLSTSLTPDGERIVSVDLADAEWAASTLEDRVPLTGPSASSPSSDLQKLRVERETIALELAKIELGRQRGELVLAKDIEARLVSVFTHCRTKLLGAASRIQHRIPTLTTDQLAVIDEVIRESLEDLAGPAPITTEEKT